MVRHSTQESADEAADKAADEAADEAAWRAAISSHGLRVTEPRLAVLREMKHTRRPVSHAELFERLEPLGFDRVTLYRNLQALTLAGILARTELGDRTWRYELVGQGETVHGEPAHFVCTGCGQVQRLPEGAVARVASALQIQAEEVQIRGRCADCLRT